MIKWLSLLFFGTALWVAAFLPIGPGSAFAQDRTEATVTITVNSSEDPDTSLSHTCTFSSSDKQPATDGKCTLRRAIVEASVRPQSDRPIAIVFNLTEDDVNRNRDAADTWTIVLTDTLPMLTTDSPANPNGQVTLDGATQPGGRNSAPPILIDTGDRPWEIGSENNQIRNVALFNGGAIVIRADNNLVENVWLGLNADGQSIRLRNPADPRRLATGGIVILSSDNIVRNNTIAGAFTPAIHVVGSDTRDNQILQNQIGTRADGTVPVVSANIACLRTLTYNANNWYGGRGISIAGRNHTIAGNRIVGIHVVQAPFDKPPTALSITGNNHMVDGNFIGLDHEESAIGVCGQAIEISGNGTKVLNNTIVHSRSGFADTAGNALNSAILADDSSADFGAITVRANIVDSGPGDVYAFGPLTAAALREFVPARIIGITDTQVTGGNGMDAVGNVSACPNCIVDLYVDDVDEIGETLAHLGSARADASGAFTFTLPQPLTANQAIRTASTTTAAGVIGNLGAGTTTAFSGLFYLGDVSVEIGGPIEGEVGEFLRFTIKVTPVELATPLTLSISSTDNTPLIGAVDTTTGLVTLRWMTPGVKTLTVNVDSPLATATGMHQIEITGPRPPLYLPNVSR
ncbi:hypothetical protein GC175_22545 [bacterium]|nr:hypothetical protein [bacterium]